MVLLQQRAVGQQLFALRRVHSAKNQNFLLREVAVFYFHFTEKEVLVFGGVYSPEREELLAYRTLLDQHHEEFQRILADKKIKRLLGGLQGEKLTRTPKGFPVGHPA